MGLPHLVWDWSETGQIAALGRVLCAALDRGGRNPATGGLIAGKAQPADVLKRELPGDAVEAMERFGLVRRDGGLIHPLFQAKSVDDFLVFSDLPRSMRATRLSQDRNSYVDPMWDGPAMTNLMPRGAVENGLDMGCGCGVIALAMSPFCRNVYALDVNPRALMLTRFNAALNGVRNIEVLESDLFSAVAGKTFERIVFNAPVGIELKPRSALESGQQILERFFSQAGPHLAPGGIIQMNLCVKEWTNATFGQSLHRWMDASIGPAQTVFLELWQIRSGLKFHARRLLAPFLVGRAQGSLKQIRRGLLFVRKRAPARGLEVPSRYNAWSLLLGSGFGEALIAWAFDMLDGKAGNPADLLAGLDSDRLPVGKEVVAAFQKAADNERPGASRRHEMREPAADFEVHQPA